MGFFDDAIRLPSAKFPEVGDAVVGIVTELGTSQVPDFDDRGRISGVKFDEDGNPLVQVDVTLAQEDGTLVVLHTGGAIFYAIGRALAETKQDDLLTGAGLMVQYTGDGEATAKGRNAPKQYRAIITTDGTLPAVPDIEVEEPAPAAPAKKGAK